MLLDNNQSASASLQGPGFWELTGNQLPYSSNHPNKAGSPSIARRSRFWNTASPGKLASQNIGLGWLSSDFVKGDCSLQVQLSFASRLDIHLWVQFAFRKIKFATLSRLNSHLTVRYEFGLVTDAMMQPWDLLNTTFSVLALVAITNFFLL